MDTSVEQSKVDTLTVAVQNDETALSNAQAQLSTDQADLATAQNNLALVSFINTIENLTEDDLAMVNGLLDEPSNILGIKLTTPTAAATIIDSTQASA